MKQLIGFLFLLLAFCGKQGYTQVLTNTTWSVYDTTETFFLYFYFDGDTMSYSEDNVSFTNISTYAEDGNTFSIQDLPPPIGECAVGDTGVYTMQIQNDTLGFTLVSEPCSDRGITIATYDWVVLATSISPADLTATVKLFPNPAQEFLSIQTNTTHRNERYRLLDQLGKQVLSGSLKEETTIVEVSHLASGIYFFQLEKSPREMLKVIKE